MADFADPGERPLAHDSLGLLVVTFAVHALELSLEDRFLLVDQLPMPRVLGALAFVLEGGELRRSRNIYRCGPSYRASWIDRKQASYPVGVAVVGAEKTAPSLKQGNVGSDASAATLPRTVTEAVIVCPQCGFWKVETMPTDACRHTYQCEGCLTLLTPLPGDCCVFCSYSDQVCPPKQAAA
jgi:hypothetical protein